MIERGLSQGPRLSKATRAVEQRMYQTARDLRKSSIGTPELLFALLDDPVVASVFKSINIQRERVVQALEFFAGRMSGVAPEPPTPKPSRLRFWRKSAVQPPVESESEPKPTLALANVVTRALNNVKRQGRDEVYPIDLLQALMEHEPSDIHGLFFEDPKIFSDLKIDKQAVLAAIKVRQEIPQAFFETNREPEPNQKS